MQTTLRHTKIMAGWGFRLQMTRITHTHSLGGETYLTIYIFL